MLYIETNSTKPYVNLAYEEYFLKKDDCNDPILMLWRNEPAVVVGRYQNTVNEINQNYIKENGINVIRRMTGGGAVYHDLGTLCYSFIMRNVVPEEASFADFAVPVLKALEKLGVKGKISGRNDLLIEDAKFSGTAMSLYKKNLLFHGTILYDTDLSVLTNALHVRKDKFSSKGIKSVRSRVTNIRSYLPESMKIEDFKEILKQSLQDDMHYEEYRPSQEDINKIMLLSIEKYKNWEWNYGKNPEAEMYNRKKFTGGELEVYIDVNESRITNCKIFGDFLGLGDISFVEKALNGIKYEHDAIENTLRKIDVTRAFGNLKIEEIVECLLGD